MAGSFEHRAGNAGERPATRTAELPACRMGQESVSESGDSRSRARCGPAPNSGAQLAAGAGENSRPSLRAGFARGGAAEGGARGARYLDTHLATSSQKVYRGDTHTGYRMHRVAVRKDNVERLVNALNKGGEEKEAKRLSCCGEWFSEGRCDRGGVRLEPNPCNSIFCVNCAGRKSRSIQRRLLTRVQAKRSNNWLLTLTVPNVPSLSRDHLDRLISCFAKLRRTKAWKSYPTMTGKRGRVTGGFYALECNVSKTRGDWHPHLHVLIQLSRKHHDVWKDELLAEWSRITGDAKNLHLDRAYSRNRRGRKLYNRVNLGTLKELVKYATKAADFADSPERVCEFLRAFKNVRRIQCFGSFVGALKGEEREPGDDGKELKCSCGYSHIHSDFTWSRRPVHISETIVGPNGERQLKWDFWVDPRDSVEESPPDFQLMRQEVERHKQYRIGFSGALPELRVAQPSLYAA
jgi:hypothetical protein